MITTDIIDYRWIVDFLNDFKFQISKPIVEFYYFWTFCTHNSRDIHSS